MSEETTAASESNLEEAWDGQNNAKVQRKPLSMSPELWPEPSMEEPDLETLEEWFMDSVCEATDGCTIEHDGCCPHGYPSWFLYLGLI